MTIAEVAELHGCNYQTVRKAMGDGVLPSHRPGKAYDIPEDAARAWIPNAPTRRCEDIDCDSPIFAGQRRRRCWVCKKLVCAWCFRHSHFLPKLYEVNVTAKPCPTRWPMHSCRLKRYHPGDCICFCGATFPPGQLPGKHGTTEPGGTHAA